MKPTAADMVKAVKGGDDEAVRSLSRKDPTLARARDEAGVSVVLLARYASRKGILDVLLDVNQPLDLFEAAATGGTTRVEELLTADPALAAAYSPDGWTALHLAAFFGQGGSARALLRHQAPVGAVTKNPQANQPLHAAAAGRHVEICETLVKAGADVNATQRGGFTPLMAAAHAGDVKLATLLLAHGADKAIKNDDGQTAYMIAKTAGHAEVMALLKV